MSFKASFVCYRHKIRRPTGTVSASDITLPAVGKQTALEGWNSMTGWMLRLVGHTTAHDKPVSQPANQPARVQCIPAPCTLGASTNLSVTLNTDENWSEKEVAERYQVTVCCRRWEDDGWWMGLTLVACRTAPSPTNVSLCGHLGVPWSEPFIAKRLALVSVLVCELKRKKLKLVWRSRQDKGRRASVDECETQHVVWVVLIEQVFAFRRHSVCFNPFYLQRWRNAGNSSSESRCLLFSKTSGCNLCEVC